VQPFPIALAARRTPTRTIRSCCRLRAPETVVLSHSQRRESTVPPPQSRGPVRVAASVPPVLNQRSSIHREERSMNRNCGSFGSRRRFLTTSAAAGAAMMTGGLGSLLAPAAVAGASGDPIWIEKTIPELQALMASGALTSRELTRGYLQRIAQLNPLLGAVIETNPHAEAIAAQYDDERRRRRPSRGPLQGIPVLVKDNIGTDDPMQTTAGSLALVDSRVPGDAVVIDRLRRAGAVILGKANLGEWANFRGFNPPGVFGWSARGGFTRNPYLLDYPSLGSSSGSAVSVVANLCAAAVGTETDGSIVSPSNANLAVGLKPTFGLVSQAGIIPISHRQDTAGPIGRTVTDVAVMLGALQSPLGRGAAFPLSGDYRRFLRRGALKGARIGVDERFFADYADYGYPGDDDTLPFFQQALDAMESLGATLVPTDTGDIFEFSDAEFTALLYEFKVDIARYLATLRHTSMRTLADLIAFDLAHCPAELHYYGQELFEAAEATSGNLADADYVTARTSAFKAARSGIAGALEADDLDAIVAPHLTNSSGPAVSGYPNLALPVGITPAGKPAGLLMYGGFLREPALLGFAYDLEQELKVRRQPQFLGTVTDPPDAGLCTTPAAASRLQGLAHPPHGRVFR
jgi:amidase